MLHGRFISSPPVLGTLSAEPKSTRGHRRNCTSGPKATHLQFSIFDLPHPQGILYARSKRIRALISHSSNSRRPSHETPRNMLFPRARHPRFARPNHRNFPRNNAFGERYRYRERSSRFAGSGHESSCGGFRRRTWPHGLPRIAANPTNPGTKRNRRKNIREVIEEVAVRQSAHSVQQLQSERSGLRRERICRFAGGTLHVSRSGCKLKFMAMPPLGSPGTSAAFGSRLWR